jgi:hypothetical protein
VRRQPASGAPAARVVRLDGGRWLQGAGFVTGPRYIVDGVLRDRAPRAADTTLDLAGGWVVPPYGEAHNHNLEGSLRVRATIAQYLRAGVFHVQNPNVLPRARAALAELVNVPAGPDVTFANGGITGPGGHPLGLAQRNVARGAWTAADVEGAFLWSIADAADLARRWPAIVAGRPDFIKVYLLHADAYARRLADTATVGWRGLDPALLPDVVRRARAARLRVVAHVETASDFRLAVAAGADQIGHVPGFRGDERARLDDDAPYRLTDADARAAAARGTIVVTTLSGAADFDPAGPDSLRRRAFDALARHNLATLHRAGVRLAVGSDSYRDDSRGEVRYLRTLGVLPDTALLRLWWQDTPRAIHPARAVGSVEPGHEASFLVLGCDPLARFACVEDIRLRVKDGQVLTLPAAP